MTLPRLVMMAGLAGVGKSTLAEGLASRLAATGAEVDLFPEEQVFTRDDWAEVAAAFRARASPEPALFLPAYRSTIDDAMRAGAWCVFDWNCSGMAGDLVWALADPPRHVALVAAVRDLALEWQPILLWLRADPEIAVGRAVAQRGEAWIERYARIAAEAGHLAGSGLERIVADSRDRAVAEAAEVQVMRDTGWEVAELDASVTENRVLSEALDALGLDGGQEPTAAT